MNGLKISEKEKIGKEKGSSLELIITDFTN